MIEQIQELTFLAHVAHLLISISFFMKDILWLRVISIVASSLLIYIGLGGNTRIGEVQVLWHLLFILIHFWRLGLLMYQRYILKLSDFENEVYQIFEQMMLPKDVRRLCNLGITIQSEEEVQIISQGSKVDQIALILEGNVLVKKDDQLIKNLSKGCFFGEFSFITGNLASADVFVQQGTKYISWNQDILKNYLKNDIDLYHHFQNILAKKLMNNMSN